MNKKGKFFVVTAVLLAAVSVEAMGHKIVETEPDKEKDYRIPRPGMTGHPPTAAGHRNHGDTITESVFEEIDKAIENAAPEIARALMEDHSRAVWYIAEGMVH